MARRRKPKRITGQAGREAGRQARPFPAHAILAKHDDFRSRYAKRDDALSQLLARATETEATADGRGLIKGVLSEQDHQDLRRLLGEGREKYGAELPLRVAELRELLAGLHPLGVLARLMATNIIGFWGEYYEPTSTGSEARVEFVAGLLSGTELSERADDPPPADAIQEVIDLTNEIFELASLLNLSREATEGGPESEVRYGARAQWLHVRGAAYPQHALALAHAVFDEYSERMRQRLGFTLDDLVAVESGVTELVETRYNALLKVAFEQAPATAAAVKPAARAQAEGGPALTDLELEQWAFIQQWDKELTHALTFHPDELEGGQGVGGAQVGPCRPRRVQTQGCSDPWLHHR